MTARGCVSRIRPLALLLGGLIACGTAQAADRYDNVKIEPKTSVNFRFYDLDAATPAQLSSSLLRQAPLGQAGRRAVGRAIYKVDWQLDTSQRKGACYLYGVKVKTQVDVLVPNWLQLSKLNADAQERWNGFLGSMLEYEAWHKDLVLSTSERIGQGIADLPKAESCQLLRQQADALGRQELEDARQQVRRYQKETANGKHLGMSLPTGL